MPFMRHATLGLHIGPIADDSPTYMYLRKQRDSNNRPVWEEQGDQEAANALGAQFPAIADPSQVQSLGIVVPALVAAAPTALFKMGVVSRPGTLVKATYVAAGAVAGQATNSRTINVLNGSATGGGAVNMASLALLGGTNLAANADNPIPLNGTPANLAANPGDEIQWQSALVGTGLADPGGIAIAIFSLTG